MSKANRFLHPSRLIVIAFFGVIALGATVLTLPFVTTSGKATGFADALFTATSAVTVTGLGTMDTETYWNVYGHWAIAILIQIGGFGIVGFATLLGYLIDGRISLKNRLSASSESAVSGKSDVTNLITSILRMTVFFQTLLFLFLTFRFLNEYDYDLPKAIGHGAFHSISAFNNAGFALYSDSLIGFARDGWIIIPIFLGAFFGSLGFPVLSETWERIKHKINIMIGREVGFMPRQWSLNSRIILWASLVLVALGAIYIAALEWSNPQTLGTLNPISKVVDSVFASIMPRTAGFNAMDITALNPATWLGMDVLMFIGGGSASTSGGIKIGTAVVLAFIVWTEIRGETAVNIGNRRLPRSIQRQALTIVGLTVTAAAIAVLYFRLTTSVSLDIIMFDVLSAVCTVGLSAGLVPELNDTGKFVLSALMFIGRVGPIALATALALRKSRKHFEYPKESPLIG